ncbi:MAG TPA: hypothetical protein VF937_09445 [Chloroflexota bacterium]
MVAVDWSGDARHARGHIWLAEADRPGNLVRLECGRDRADLGRYLSRRTDVVAIGLDFAFAFPAWFTTTLGIRAAPELWTHASQYGEAWLSACRAPFWGRPGQRRPMLAGAALRRAEELAPRTSGIAPKSIFQIGGAGAVGTGSIRGMPLLRDLHARGMTIWPFTVGVLPMVVEIYPRLLTGGVRKSDPRARAALLERRYPHLEPGWARQAAASEDAFDAAVSALVMVEHVADLASLPAEVDPVLRLEGRIWHPAWRDDAL